MDACKDGEWMADEDVRDDVDISTMNGRARGTMRLFSSSGDPQLREFEA